MKTLQLTQNRLLRTLNKTRVTDKVSIKLMLEKFKLLSVNQLSAEIKLIEVWKSINVGGCPISLAPYNQNQGPNDYLLRPKPTRVFKDTSRLMMSQSSFNIDAAKVWNMAPIDVQSATTICGAKRAIKKFCKSLPI